MAGAGFGGLRGQSEFDGKAQAAAGQSGDCRQAKKGLGGGPVKVRIAACADQGGTDDLAFGGEIEVENAGALFVVCDALGGINKAAAELLGQGALRGNARPARGCLPGGICARRGLGLAGAGGRGRIFGGGGSLGLLRIERGRPG